MGTFLKTVDKGRVALHCAALRRDGILDGPQRHPTAAEIFEAVNRVDPALFRATTYNNLRDLVQAGLKVREVAIEGPRRAIRSERHAAPTTHLRPLRQC